MRRVEYTIEGPKLEIALVTDLHDRDPAKVIRILRSRPADIICITGDMTDKIYHNRLREKTLDTFRAIAETGKTYFSLGNHERALGLKEMSMITKTGVTVLENRYVKLSSGLWLGGLTSMTYENPDDHGRTYFSDFIDRFSSLYGYRILMCHHPEYYEWYLKNKKLDLVLSGHAHGGQWRLFGRGVYSPGQGLWPKYTRGVYDDHLVVSAGCANSTIIPRIFNPTEVVFVKLGEKDTCQKPQSDV